MAGAGARRYKASLKAFRWRDIKMLVSDSLDGWSKHKARRLGASLACYSLLSLAPLVLVVTAVVGLVFGQRMAEHDIIERVRMLVGKGGAKSSGGFAGRLAKQDAWRDRYHSWPGHALIRCVRCDDRAKRCAEYDLGSTGPRSSRP